MNRLRDPECTTYSTRIIEGALKLSIPDIPTISHFPVYDTTLSGIPVRVPVLHPSLISED